MVRSVIVGSRLSSHSGLAVKWSDELDDEHDERPPRRSAMKRVIEERLSWAKDVRSMGRGFAAFGFIVCLQAMTWACSSRITPAGPPVPPQPDRPPEPPESGCLHARAASAASGGNAARSRGRIRRLCVDR